MDSERETQSLCCMGGEDRVKGEQVSREMRAEGYRLPTPSLALVSVSPEAVPQGRFGGMWLI